MRDELFWCMRIFRVFFDFCGFLGTNSPNLALARDRSVYSSSQNHEIAVHDVNLLAKMKRPCDRQRATAAGIEGEKQIYLIRKVRLRIRFSIRFRIRLKIRLKIGLRNRIAKTNKSLARLGRRITYHHADFWGHRNQILSGGDRP